MIEEVRDFLQSIRAYVGSDGRLLYPSGVDTVDIVMWNMTGDPKPVQQPPKQEIKPAVENYREGKGSTVTHNGKEYSVDKLLELTKDVKATNTPMEYLEWMRDSVKDLDPKRVANADPTIPMIAVMDGPWIAKKVIVLDGSHRMAKLFEQNAYVAPIRFIPANKLELALVNEHAALY